MNAQTHPSAAIHPVLVIGGDSAYLQSIVDVLQGMDAVQIECRAVQVVAEAQTALHERQWHTILCACDTPTISPISLLQWAQKTQPPVPIIFLSDTTRVAEVVDIMRQGARGVVDPADSQRLMSMVQQELDAYTQSPVSADEAIPSRRRDYRDEILDTMQDAIVSSALPERKITYSNLAFESLYGYPIGYFLVDRNFFQQIIHPADMQQALAAMQTSLREGAVEVEHRIVLPDKRVRWLHRRIWTTYDENGHPTRLNDLASDITERKEADRALRENQQRLQSLLDNLQDVVWTMELSNSRVSYLNPVAETIFGKPVSAFYENNQLWIDMIHPEDAAQVDADFVELIAQGEHTSEYRIVRPDGSVRWLRNHAWAVKDEAGRPIRLEGIASDVTDYKQAEINLRERHRFLADILENSGSVTYVKRRDGVYLEVNREWVKSTRLPREQVVGKKDEDLFPPETAQQFRSNDLRVIESGETLKVEEVLNTPDGERYFISIKFPTRDSDGLINGLCGMSTDITEQKQTELALRASETKQKAILSAMPDLMFHLRADGTFLDFHGPAVDLALPPEQIRNLKVQEFLAAVPGTEPVIQQMTEAMHTVAATRQLVTFEYTLLVQGDLRPFEARLGPIGDTDDLIVIIRDMTERKKAEEALRQSQAKQAALLAAIPDLMFHMQADGTFLDFHGPSSKLAMPKDVILGKKAQDTFALIPGSETAVQRTDEALQAIAASRQLVTFEYALLGPTTLEHYEARLVPLGDTDEVIAIIRDITERKQAEEALQSANERLEQRVTERTAELERIKNRIEAIFNHSGDGILLLDIQYGIQQANYACNVLFGLSDNSYLTRSLSSFFSPEDAAHIEQTIQQVAQTHQMRHVEAAIAHADGSVSNVELNIAPINRSQNSVTNLVCIIRDITERKRAEPELLTLSRRLQLATAAGGIGIWDWNLESDRMLWNDQMFSLYDLSREAFDETGDGTRLAQWAHPDDSQRLSAEIEAALKNDTLLDTEYRVIHHDGTVHNIKLNTLIIRNSTGQAVRMLGVNWDITLLKRAEENLQVALQKEKEVSELRSRFVSMASHEFRTPLSVILATTDTLAIYREKMDWKQASARLDKIRQQVGYMKGIMEDVLQLASMQSGQAHLELDSGDLVAFCADIIGDYETQDIHRGRIRYNAPVDSPPMLFDLRLMRQVIGNLISNALKYSPREKPVQVRVEREHAQIRIVVSDEGIGIPEKDLKHLFEPFHRATNVGKISGTGLGLSIAKQAAELHSGTLTIQSQVGQGTTIMLLIPIRTQMGNGDSLR